MGQVEHPLAGVRGKLARADYHLVMLEGEIAAYLAREPYRISYEREVEGTEHVLRAHVVEPIPLLLGLLIGDCVQNMRNALEHLAWQLVIVSGVTQPNRATGFPIAADEGGFRRVRTQIREMSPPIQAIIEQLQPYQGGDIEPSPLLVLHDLARLDRHQTLHTVATVHEGTTYSWGQRDETGAFFLAPTLGRMYDQLTFGPFEDGAEIARFVLRPAQPEMHVQCQFAFDIAFGDRGPAAHFPVVDSLGTIHDWLTTGLLPNFLPFFPN